MARPKKEEDKSLTTVELQVMNILWQKGSCNVHEVQEALIQKQHKDYAYTTVSTLLRILEKKSIVKSQKEGRGHIYTPLMTQNQYQKTVTHHLVEQVYNGKKTHLILNLLGQAQFSSQELNEIQKIIQQKSDKK